MDFFASSATSRVQARLTWAYLTQHLPFLRFLTSPRGYVPYRFVALFHATTAPEVSFTFRVFPMIGSRDCLQSATLLTLQDNLTL